jgi:hypothetical protein
MKVFIFLVSQFEVCETLSLMVAQEHLLPVPSLPGPKWKLLRRRVALLFPTVVGKGND